MAQEPMIRNKVLFLSLGAMAVLAVVTSLVKILIPAIGWDVFLKIMGTLLMVGTEISFLIAVNYDAGTGRRKWILSGLVALTTVATILTTLQIWVQPLEWHIFLKILAPIGAAIFLGGLLLVTAGDPLHNKRLEDRN